MNYLSPEDYEIAEKNGISRKHVYIRFYHKGWDRERAITQPLVRPVGLYTPYAHVSVVDQRTFYRRIEKGWSPDKAATTPRRNGNQHSRKGE